MGGKPSVLILGGGAGGVSTAYWIYNLGLADSVEVTLIDSSPLHYYKGALPRVAVGALKLEDVSAPLEALTLRGVKFLRGRVSEIDAGNRRVKVNGSYIGYDYLVVSLGMKPDFGAVEGLAGESFPPWTPDTALEFRDRFSRIRGGNIIVGIVSPPYPCPPAPYSFAGLVRGSIVDRGLGDKVEVAMVSPEPKPVYNLGPAVSDTVMRLLRRGGVKLTLKARISEVNARERAVTLEDGERLKYDLLAIVPPFKPPEVIRDSDLSDGAWMKVDPSRSFRHPKYDDVYGVGDVIAPYIGFPPTAMIAYEIAGIVASSMKGEVVGVSGHKGLKAVAICPMDLGVETIVPFCDATGTIMGEGMPVCGKILTGALANVLQALLLSTWFSIIIPKKQYERRKV